MKSENQVKSRLDYLEDYLTTNPIDSDSVHTKAVMLKWVLSDEDD